MYKFIIPDRSPLCKAVKRVLVMLAVPEDRFTCGGENFAVVAGSCTYPGLVPLVSSLRSMVTSNDLRDFVGASAAVAPLVDQWVSLASLLSADAAGHDTGNPVPSSSRFGMQVLVQIEKSIDFCDLKKGYLAGTPRPTIADLLLYTAVHAHPLWRPDAYLCIQTWSLNVQKSDLLAPVLSELLNDLPPTSVPVTSCDKNGTLAASRKGKGEKPVYAKPSEDEILRRKQEKERAKLAKAAAGATATSASLSVAAGDKKQCGGGPQGEKKAAATLNPNQLDLRVGRFKNVRCHPNSDRLYVEDMDIGSETRTVVSGLVEYHKAEELEGTLCIAVCNLKPRALRDVVSHGMILCASNDSGLRILRPPEGAKPGDRILFGDVYNAGYQQDSKQLSGNIMSDLLGPLRVDDKGIVRWNDVPAQHALGTLQVPDMQNAVVK